MGHATLFVPLTQTSALFGTKTILHVNEVKPGMAISTEPGGIYEYIQ